MQQRLVNDRTAQIVGNETYGARSEDSLNDSRKSKVARVSLAATGPEAPPDRRRAGDRRRRTPRRRGIAPPNAAPSRRRRAPDATLHLQADSTLDAGAAVAGALACAAIAGQLPAGLLTPREARAPQTLLAEIEKRGVRVTT